MTNLNNLTIGKRLFLTAGLLLGLTLLLGVITLVKVGSVHGQMERLLADSLPGLKLTAAIDAGGHDIRGNLWRHMADARGRQQMESDTAKEDASIRAALQECTRLADTDEERLLAERATTLHDAWMRSWNVVAPLSREGRTGEAVQAYLRDVEGPYRAMLKAVDELAEHNERAAEQQAKEARAGAERARTWTWSLLAFAILAGSALTAVVTRSTNQTLQQAAEELSVTAGQVASAAQQVSSASQSLAEGSSEQAAAVEETSATAQEVTSMAKQNADNARQAAAKMEQSQSTAGAMQKAVEDLSDSMGKIDASSVKISAIIRVIDEIAFQTNILALNAAVEAARAGDAGMGFAVVADEVRNLAQRSAQAARDTAALIEGAVSDTSMGSRKVQEVVEAMKLNAGIGRKVTELVDHISSASREQATGVEQISRAMSHIEEATQKAAANAEESAAASQELTAQAHAMRAVVGRIETLSGRRNG